METNSPQARSWTLTAAWCGIGGVLAYLGAAFLPLPDALRFILAFAFGPLVSTASLGLVHAVRPGDPRVGVQLAGFFGAAAGIVVLAMLTVQQALFAAYAHISEADAACAALVSLGNAVHFGLDVAWDCLIAMSIVLFAVHFWRSPSFGRIFGATGLACGSLLFAINMAAFPEPPGSIGLLDMGPFCALWLLAVYVRSLLVARRSVGM